MKQEPITQKGLEAIKAKVESLTLELRETRKRRDTQFVNSLPDDTDYIFIQEEMSAIENKIQELKSAIAASVVFETKELGTETVKFGLTVTLTAVEDENKSITYTLVGPLEANVNEGRISVRCRVGSILLGKEVEDEIEIDATSYYISKIENLS